MVVVGWCFLHLPILSYALLNRAHISDYQCMDFNDYNDEKYKQID